MNYVFEPKARLDFSSAVEWYLLQAGDTHAHDFEAEVYRGVKVLLRLPKLGASVRHGLRRWQLKRYPYAIIYRDEPELIRIFALAHHRRKPSYWAKQVK